MKKVYLSATLLVLIFGTFSTTFALEGDAALRATTTNGVKVNAELKANLEAQRAKMRAEAEARRKAALAKGDATTTRREALKLELEKKRAEMDARRETERLEIEAKRASSTERRVEWQKDLAERKVAHVVKLMAATIERLEKIIVRIESRIAKVGDRGGNTTESEGYLASAKDQLSQAKASLVEFSMIELTSDKARENFEKIKTEAAETREHIRAAHEKMVMAIRSLGNVEIDVTATSSIEVTN